MIVTCPSCATRYIVEAAALGPTGRMVRCANCSHTWHQASPPDLPKAVDLAPPPTGTLPIPPGSNLPTLARPRPSRFRAASTIGWLVFLIVVFGGAAGVIAGRNEVVKMWPPASRLYEQLGLPLDFVGEGLTLDKVSSTRRDETGALVVEGTVVNTSDKPREVPKLKAVVTGGNKQVLKDWTFSSGVLVLMPGESAAFKAELPEVPRAGTDLVVTFTEG